MMQTVDLITTATNHTTTKLSVLSQAFLNQVQNWFPKLISGAVVFLFFYLITYIVVMLLRHGLSRSKQHKPIINLLLATTKISILLIGVVTALGTMGIDISAIVASLGLLGFALGFALKDFVSNLLAGVMILFYRPFEVGQQISGSGFSGEVEEINLRYTVLKEKTKTILIPNASMLTQVINIDSV